MRIALCLYYTHTDVKDIWPVFSGQVDKFLDKFLDKYKIFDGLPPRVKLKILTTQKGLLEENNGYKDLTENDVFK